MKDFITLVTEYISPERLHQLQRALEIMRDCAKEAMTNARNDDSERASIICRGAYQATCHQLKTLERIMLTKEGD